MSSRRGAGKAAGGGLGFGFLILFLLLGTTKTGQHIVHGTQKTINGISRHLPGAGTESPASDTTTSARAATAGALPIGAGPQGHYTVQPQPAAGSCHYRWLDKAKGLVLPDARCTPGATSPKVTQSTIGKTICVSGYTSSIRPPESITSREKTANAKSYGYTGSMHTAEYDHLVSLQLGGDPNDARNLFVEPNRAGAPGTTNPKDAVETKLKNLVCGHTITLAAAQTAIATNWTTALAVVGHPSGK